MPEWRDRRHGVGDEGKHSSVPGMEQQGLLIVDEVLVEGEAGRPDIGDERREPVDAVGDLADLRIHVLSSLWIRGVGLEGKGVAPNVRAVAAFGQDPAELNGIHVHVLATGTCSIVASGWAVEHKGEGLVVGVCPFGDYAAIVIGIEIEWLARRLCQVDAVHPHVMGQADVKKGKRAAGGRRVQGDRAEEAGRWDAGAGSGQAGPWRSRRPTRR